MVNQIIAGIDIGTGHIRIGTAKELLAGETALPKMIGFGMAESKGLRHGCVIEKEETVKSLEKAKQAAEKNIGNRIKSAVISVGGIGLGSLTSSGEIIVSKADLEVTDLDIEKIVNLAEENIPSSISLNRKILHTIPLSYKLDGKSVVGNPIGMRGTKLEAKCLFITVVEKNINDLIDVVEEAGIEVLDVVASPIAASLVLLSKQQKRAGCLLVNIGSETVSSIVYENNVPSFLEILPTGGSHVTNDIALGLKISLEEAEHLKLGGLTTSSYSKKKLEEIIEARLNDIFDMIETQLKKIGRNGLLPAGVIFSGGGSGINNLEELAKLYLELPAQTGVILHNTDNTKNTVKDSSWATVYGLCLIGLEAKKEGSQFSGLLRKTGLKAKRFLKQFLP